jgi:phosphotransferase system IIB component
MKQTNIDAIEKLVTQLQTELNNNDYVTDKALELNDLLQIEVKKYQNIINGYDN